jgi:hypothetical protein
MKIADGLKLIENGWIRKPKGFRVRFHRQTETGIEKGLSPPPEVAPLNSDVTAWRYAWKLWQATRAAAETGDPGALYNITVVDDQDRPFRFFGSGDFRTYSPKHLDDEGGKAASEENEI